MTKNTPEIKPYFKDDKQPFNEKSWVLVLGEAAVDDSVRFYYANEDVLKKEEIQTLKEFVEFVLENHNYERSYESVTNIEKDTFYSETQTVVKEQEDFDEDSGKSWKSYVGSVLIVQAYKGGISKDDLLKMEINISNEMDNEIYNATDAAKETELYNKDPYQYYGVNRKDFM